MVKKWRLANIYKLENREKVETFFENRDSLSLQWYTLQNSLCGHRLPLLGLWFLLPPCALFQFLVLVLRSRGQLELDLFRLRRGRVGAIWSYIFSCWGQWGGAALEGASPPSSWPASCCSWASPPLKNGWPWVVLYLPLSFFLVLGKERRVFCDEVLSSGDLYFSFFLGFSMLKRWDFCDLVSWVPRCTWFQWADFREDFCCHPCQISFPRKRKIKLCFCFNVFLETYSSFSFLIETRRILSLFFL